MNADTTRVRSRVADINVTDEDGGLPVCWSWSVPDALLFELNGDQDRAVADRRRKSWTMSLPIPLLEVTVQVMGNPAVSADLSIPVTNVPEAPTEVTLRQPGGHLG